MEGQNLLTATERMEKPTKDKASEPTPAPKKPRTRLPEERPAEGPPVHRIILNLSDPLYDKMVRHCYARGLKIESLTIEMLESRFLKPGAV